MFWSIARKLQPVISLRERQPGPLDPLRLDFALEHETAQNLSDLDIYEMVSMKRGGRRQETGGERRSCRRL
jgi:hypothetical protein